MTKQVLTSMEWKKAPEELIKFLEERMKKVDCEHRTMFGYPAYFINGNMFAGAFQDILFLRLSEPDRAKIEKVESIDQALRADEGKTDGRVHRDPETAV